MLRGGKWNARALDKAIAAIDVRALAGEYSKCVDAAPRRAVVGKRYFVGHTGLPGAAGQSNRAEEHLAVALCNLRRRWPRADGGWFQMLDYQVPLKARRSDRGIGKIDILSITDRGRLIVHELKVKSRSGGKGEAPPAALMQGLRYAAVVEANAEAIAHEADSECDASVTGNKPIVQVLAPCDWWDAWFNLAVAGDWSSELAGVTAQINDSIDVPIEYAAIENTKIEPGQPPSLDRIPAIYSVSLENRSMREP